MPAWLACKSDQGADAKDPNGLRAFDLRRIESDLRANERLVLLHLLWVVPKWQRDGVVSLSPSTLFDLDLNQNIFRTSEVAEDGKGADPEHKDGYLLLRADQPSNQKWSLTTLDVDGSSVKAVNAATSGGEIIPKVVSDLDGTTLYANYSAVKLSKVCGKTLSEGDSVFSLFGHDISKEILSSLTVANLPHLIP